MGDDDPAARRAEHYSISRSFRLTPAILQKTLAALEPVWKIAEGPNISRTALALSFFAGPPEVSTIIPGIKTPEQAEENCRSIFPLPADIMHRLTDFFPQALAAVVSEMERAG